MGTKTWARLDGTRVAELVTLSDTLVPGVDVYTPDHVFVDVTNVANVAIDWTYADGTFSPPATRVVDPPTITELVARALAYRDQVMNAGIMVTLQASGQPDLALQVDTTGDGRANILGLQKLDDFGHPIVWIESTGPGVLTRPQLDTLGVQAGLYVGNCYAAWAGVVADIASGAVATNADVTGSTRWPSQQITAQVVTQTAS